jgi:hypothetical protein
LPARSIPVVPREDGDARAVVVAVVVVVVVVVDEPLLRL